MLAHDETLGLIKRAQDGEEDAKETLVRENLPLVRSVVKRFKGRLEYDDLMQLGMVGFLKAVAGFDTSFGVRFSTYAVPMIMGEIKRFLRDDGAVKVSRWAKSLAGKIAAYTDEQLKNNRPEPTVDELAEKFGCEPAEVVFALDTGRFVVSLNEAGDEDGTPLGDRLVGAESPDEDMDGMMLRDSTHHFALFPRQDAERSGSGTRSVAGAGEQAGEPHPQQNERKTRRRRIKVRSAANCARHTSNAY